jgi:flagellar M-ring protein FliF
MMMEFWNRLQPRARRGLAAGAAVAAGLTAAFGYWALHPEQKVLFADLTPQDAAAMVAELDRMKAPYTLADSGNTILMPAGLVDQTRLKLMGQDLPLHGAVGLELFNNSDIGMTEFAQKINNQRAQQGELTRTILSLEGVQAARVHLALADQGLFRKSGRQNKASVTVTMKPGVPLRADQVQGIQRLVAAATPNLEPHNVTVLDQHGAALTARSEEGDGEPVLTGRELEDKRSLEQYLNRKLDAVLERSYGPDQAIASVDVTLNHQRSKTTTESVLPAPGSEGAEPAGVLVRQKTSTQAGAAAAAASRPDEVLHAETDYQVGRRVEQVVSAQATISRLNVAVVVRKALDAGQLQQLREVVALAVGYNQARGDGIAVQSLAQLAPPEPPAAAAAPVLPPPAAAAPAAGPGAGALPVLAGLLILALAVLAWVLRRPGRMARPAALTEGERAAALAQVRQWIELAPETTLEPRQ